MPHNTPWSKKEIEFLINFIEVFKQDYEHTAFAISFMFGNNRTESSCITMYQKLKEK